MDNCVDAHDLRCDEEGAESDLYRRRAYGDTEHQDLVLER